MWNTLIYYYYYYISVLSFACLIIPYALFNVNISLAAWQVFHFVFVFFPNLKKHMIYKSNIYKYYKKYIHTPLSLQMLCLRATLMQLLLKKFSLIFLVGCARRLLPAMVYKIK